MNFNEEMKKLAAALIEGAKEFGDTPTEVSFDNSGSHFDIITTSLAMIITEYYDNSNLDVCEITIIPRDEVVSQCLQNIYADCCQEQQREEEHVHVGPLH